MHLRCCLLQHVRICLVAWLIDYLDDNAGFLVNLNEVFIGFLEQLLERFPGLAEELLFLKTLQL